MRLDQAISLLRPEAEWRLVGTEYEGLEWLDPIQEKPTKEEVIAFQIAYSYREQRKKAYPPIGDQLDALWKGGQAAIDMKATVDAVKAQFPKPE